MKKKNILNLIKYHTENNDEYFRNEAYEIAKYLQLHMTIIQKLIENKGGNKQVILTD